MNDEKVTVEVTEVAEVMEPETALEPVVDKKEKLVKGLKTAGKIARNVLAIVGGGVLAVMAVKAIKGDDDLETIDYSADVNDAIDVDYKDVETTETTEE